MISKQKIISTFYLLSLILSIFFIFQISNFYYLISESPDFFHLKSYLDYNFREIEETNRDLGLAYFNLVAISISFKTFLITETNFNHIISSRVLLINTILYCVGLTGLFKFLIINKFKKNDILASFIIITYFPQTINMINTMKPEIFAFSIVTWVLYFIELYIQSEKINYLFFAAFPSALLLTTKSSIFFFSIILFAYIFLKNYKKFLKIDNFKPFCLFIFLFSLLLYENIKVNNFSIFQHISSSSDGSYENIASLNILYKINFKYLFTQPFSNFHANSIIGIILLDTFGDYFNFWAFNDESIFVINKIKIPQFWVITHYSQFFSIVFTILLYFSFFYFSRYNKKFKPILFSPIFSIILLIFNSFGIPIKNYNPLTSDTFKTHYYSFLIVISFCIVLLLLFKMFNRIKLKIFLLIFFSSMYLYGFPKLQSSELDEYLIVKNSVTFFCEFNSHLIDQYNTSSCNNLTYQICNISKIINNSDSTQISNNVSVDYSSFLPIELKNENSKVNVRNVAECIKFTESNYYPNRPYQQKLRINIINLTTIIIFFILIFIHNNLKIYKKIDSL